MGFFEQIARADRVVWLDTVQFVRREWDNRNRLKGPDSKPFWLTVPVLKHARETQLKDIRISTSETEWKRKHLAAIRGALGKAPFFDAYYPLLQDALEVEYVFLADMNIVLITAICGWLGLKPEMMRASELSPEGRKADLILDICKKSGATHYYSAAGAFGYMEQSLGMFSDSGISVQFQAWDHPEYSQAFGDFVSHMSVLDALMNVGHERVCEMITDCDGEGHDSLE